MRVEPVAQEEIPRQVRIEFEERAVEDDPGKKSLENIK